MLRILCAALLAVGLGLFAYRALVLGFPLLPGEKTKIWSFEIQAEISSSADGAKVGIYAPPERGNYRALSERFLSDRLSLTVRTDSDGNRRAVWSTTELDLPTSVYYRARLHRQPLTAENIPQRLGPSELPSGHDFVSSRSNDQLTLAERMASDIDADAFDIDTLAALLLERLVNEGDSIATQLLDGDDGAVSVARAAAYVLSRAGVSARVANGISLRDTEQTLDPTAWLQVWDGDRWQAYDPLSGDPVGLEDELVMWFGDGDLVTVEGANLRNVRIALSGVSVGALDVLAGRLDGADRPLVLATLLDLPVNNQLVIRALLMIPVGVLVLVFLRQFVGVPTFGTFMPVLIALAFNSASLAMGLIILGIVLGVGMSFRFFFSKLNLLLVPRLASMLTVIVMVMILTGVVADSYALGSGFTVTLFPIVILTMTIERLAVTWEENGPVDSFKEFAGSVVVAVCAYLAMNIPQVEHLLFMFPELLLVLLAIMLAMGRYSGLRLTELRRFRQLSKEGKI